MNDCFRLFEIRNRKELSSLFLQHGEHGRVKEGGRISNLQVIRAPTLAIRACRATCRYATRPRDLFVYRELK